MNCPRWENETAISQKLTLPEDDCELWTIVLHMAHVYEPLIREEYPRWSLWLSKIPLAGVSTEIRDSAKVRQVAQCLGNQFARADQAIANAIQQLKQDGFPDPAADHVLQLASRNDKTVPVILLRAAAGVKAVGTLKRTKPRSVTPIHPYILPSKERLGFWGFHDTSFVLNVSRTDRPHVSVTGDRYMRGGKRFSKLIPFVEKAVGVKIDPTEECGVLVKLDEHEATMASALGQAEVESLRQVCQTVSMDIHDRTRHGTGHALSDVYNIRFGEKLRIPDVVVWPATSNEVLALVTLAKGQWCLIPYGGGTCVSRAICCPTIQQEPRPIISVDMSKLNQVIKMDYENHLAHVQAGITGKELNEQLNRFGYTVGHEPDSMEFSTLGGWIATKASGMKRNRYGNIEDIVTGIQVVGAGGLMNHGHWGRESCGVDLTALLLGSEGCLGIIVSAVLRIQRLPEICDHEAILLPDWESGVHLLRDLSRQSTLVPASVRLLDHEHFQLGQALRPDPESLYEKAKETLAHSLLALFLNKNNKSRAVCLAVGYEGSQAEVQAQQTMIRGLTKSYGGLRLGRQAGQRAYEMTFMIAYLRDFAMSYQILGESFETFAPWSTVHSIVKGTKTVVRQLHERLHLPGKPFLGCRVTQLYSDGVCLYFYLCMSSKGIVDPLSVFGQLEEGARQEILRCGGSLSHHHGLGKHRSHFLDQVQSPPTRQALQQIKEAMDPDNIFGAQNGPFHTSMPPAEGS